MPEQPCQILPHQVYTWRGSAREIGFQHGRVLRAEIVAEAQRAMESFARARGWPERQALDFAMREWAPLFREHVPRAMEEIRGMAAGGGFDEAWMFFAAVHGGTKSNAPGRPEACTALACGPGTTRQGHVLMGQTKDTSAPLTRYRIMRLAYDDGLGNLLLNYPGFISHLCLSSHGLFCTANSLYARQPEGEVTPFSFIRALAKEKTSTEDVLSAIRGLSFDNGCTIVGDRGGRLACIEAVAGRTRIRDVSAEVFAHANSILSEDLQRYEQASPHLASSPRRQIHMQRLLDAERGRLTVETLKGFLADHTDAPCSICRHPDDLEPGWTTAAVVADLTARKLHICIGNPCVAPFVEYGMACDD